MNRPHVTLRVKQWFLIDAVSVLLFFRNTGTSSKQQMSLKPYKTKTCGSLVSCGATLKPKWSHRPIRLPVPPFPPPRPGLGASVPLTQQFGGPLSGPITTTQYKMKGRPPRQMERRASWSRLWHHHATLDNNAAEGKLGHHKGEAEGTACVYVSTGACRGSEAGVMAKISGKCVCVTIVKPALMGINKT